MQAGLLKGACHAMAKRGDRAFLQVANAAFWKMKAGHLTLSYKNNVLNKVLLLRKMVSFDKDLEYTK